MSLVGQASVSMKLMHMSSKHVIHPILSFLDSQVAVYKEKEILSEIKITLIVKPETVFLYSRL